MNTRCLRRNLSNFCDYGGRGITVCDRWSRLNINGFVNFVSDMGERPSIKHSIDRMDNNDGYYPENCRWATQIQQGNNQRSNVTFTYKEETKTVTQWSRITGVNKSTAFNRIRNGWSFVDALELEGKKL